MASIELATFFSQARGILFYDCASRVGLVFTCILEAGNLYDPNCVALMVTAATRMLGHLAREAAQMLAPLLRAGFQANG